MVLPLIEVNHSDDLYNNLLSQYKDSPVFIDFINSFLIELNDLETEFTLFKTILLLANAEGQNLNLWGLILDAKTRPADDDTFRVLLYALIGAYNSDGRPKDIRALILSVLNADNIFIDDNGEATFSFTVFNPTFTFSPELVSDIVSLAKPAGVEFLGYTIADLYSQDTFSFAGDNRPSASTFALAAPVRSPLTNWDNYVFAPSGSITETRRVYYETNPTTRESSFTFVTDLADTQWRADMASLFDGAVGTVVGWYGLSGDVFYNVLSLATTGVLIDVGPTGDSYYTKIQLINSSGVSTAVVQINRTIAVADKLAIHQSDLEINDTDPVITLARTLQEDAFDPNKYGVIDGGRYSILIS